MMGKRAVTAIAVAVILSSVAPLPGSAVPLDEPVAAVRAEPAVPLDVPTILVSNGVDHYDLVEPKVFWHTEPAACPPPRRAPEQTHYERIARLPTYGGIIRALYDEEVVCPFGSTDFHSNMIADEDYVYWMSDSYGGVVRLSTDANRGDALELLSNAVSGPSELAQDDEYIYVLPTSGAHLWRLRKTNGSAFIRVTSPGTSPHNLQADGQYVYWITGGQLKRIPREGTAFVTTIATSVSGYFPEGRRGKYCIPGQCFYSEYVFIGQGTQIVRYDNLEPTSPPVLLYTSSDGTARVYSLTTHYGGFVGPSLLFFFESREYDCDPFCDYNNTLFRTSRSAGGAVDLLYQVTGPETIQIVADHLKTNETFLFWDELGALKRLPEDAAALVKINISARGMEITQGFQDSQNSVRLIEGKRTVVRVRADTVDTPVPGVTAYLYRTNSSGVPVEGPLVPVNPVGQQITVQPWTNRAKLNDTFLFEIPLSWTTGPLYLKAVVNPNRYPLEPTYADNDVLAGPFDFSPSPRLPVQFVAFRYDIDGVYYQPRYVEDVLQTYSWIRRAYPLASAPGGMTEPSPGFRPRLWTAYNAMLGGMVDGTAALCANLIPDPKYRSGCASWFTNVAMSFMRVEHGLPADLFMYGLISDEGGWPRGQAFPEANVSSGPAGTRCCKCTVWDKDGSCTDWYAGHEIGHTLGREHPVEGADICGHGGVDPDYPYAGAKIHDSSGFGFDLGDAGLNPALQMAVYPWYIWADVMTYCDYLWISDYTYEAMYDYMMASDSQDVTGSSGLRIDGDFLSVFGAVFPDSGLAAIARLRHLDSVAEIPPLVPGDYSIRLLDAGGNPLADYPFTPGPIAGSDQAMLGFGQVVDHVPGTAEVQIVRLSDDGVLTDETLSANPPSVSDVAVQDAPSPGAVTLTWNANDPDGDDLAFDILYSMDGGASFQPVHMDVAGNSTQIDTTQLGGSNSAVLRVVANDRVHTAQADSDPFTVPGKPPQPYILSPADGTQIHWGQLLTFIGEAFDPQDGSVTGADLIWSNQYGQLGTGRLLSIHDLPVGANEITLEATNSLGLSGSAQITVVVDDDLNWPGPTLSVGPTQVGWHVGVGEAQPQTAELSLSNAGTGSMDWEASEDASWLMTGAVTGTMPFTLTLTAFPAGLEGGTVLTTTLRITGWAGPVVSQTVEIPVTLSVGDVYRPPFTWLSIYLPLVLRQAQP